MSALITNSSSMNNFHLNISENVISLWGKVVLHESLLTPTIPQVENKVAQKPVNR